MATKTRTPWTTRLNPSTGYMAEFPDAGSHESEMTLSFSNETGAEWELDCAVFAEYEPGQNGGHHDPSWEAYFHSPVAYWFRPGHGWKEVELTESQQEKVCEHFALSCDSGYDGPEPDYDDRDYY
jgi:hypothetical protein